MTTTRNNKTHTNPDTQAATNQAARPAKRAQPAQPARSGKGAAASKRIRKNPASIARSEVEENEATSDREEGEASELEPISAADEEETPDRTQTQTSRAKPKKGVKTTFVTASDVKILKVLSHNNICELEQFLKRTGQNGEPDTTNIEESLFDILDGKFTHEAVEDHALWRQKPMLTWVIPISNKRAVLQVAQKVQSDKDKNHMISGDTTQTEYADNSYVLVQHLAQGIKKGPPNKLNTYLRGPLRVISHFGSTYKLQNLVTNKVESVHVTQLRQFHYDEENTNPIDVANRDSFVTVVDQIVDHAPRLQSYKNTKRSELQFQVRWKGLSEDFDRILPYKELRNNPRLHEYLIANNMRSFVPPEHKT
jgi:hypothetical protein